MRSLKYQWRGLRRQENGSAAVEFALVVPVLFLLVWGALNISRAYQRLNVLTGSLREGARLGATQSTCPGSIDQAAVRSRVSTYSTAFGFPIDVNQVTAVPNGNEVWVSVTNYPLFSDLTNFGTLSSITVTRRAKFRCERS